MLHLVRQRVVFDREVVKLKWATFVVCLVIAFLFYGHYSYVRGFADHSCDCQWATGATKS